MIAAPKPERGTTFSHNAALDDRGHPPQRVSILDHIVSLAVVLLATLCNVGWIALLSWYVWRFVRFLL